MSNLTSKLTVVFPAVAVAFILLIFSLALPLLRQPVSFPAEGRRMTRRDRLLCALITAVYALTAFIGLGNTQGVESFCKFRGQGQYALIELPENTYVSVIRYFHGLYAGEYYVEFSDDGEYFTYVASMEARYKDVFKWKKTVISEGWGEDWDRPVRYLRITASRPLWLGEVAIYDDRGVQIPAASMGIPDGCRKLFDEQDKIPAGESFMNSTYFDEIYHARTAYEHIENVYPYEITHPPLGKLLLGLGIRIFGMVPFGWRFMGTLFGVLMLPAIYLVMKKMFGGTLVPACCTTVLASDFMHFSQTRLATIDTYEVLFIIMMYGFFWCYWTAPRERRRDWLPPLAMAGVSFGLGAASKWTGFYAGAGLAVLWLIDRVRRVHLLRKAKTEKGKKRAKAAGPLRETVENILWCLLFFVLIPAAIYYCSYWSYGTAKELGGGLGMLFSKDYLQIVLDNQKYMFTYHAGVTATHPYSSVWWQWVLDIRPILYYLKYLPDGREQSIGAWLNPMLCWGGLLAMGCMAYLAAAKRDRTALFILIGYLAQLLPWVFVTRVVFEYHYFPGSIFLLLALGHIFRTVELRYPQPKPVILSFTIVSVILFAAFFPALTGITVPRWYDLKLLKWLPTWPF